MLYVRNLLLERPDCNMSNDYRWNGLILLGVSVINDNAEPQARGGSMPVLFYGQNGDSVVAWISGNKGRLGEETLLCMRITPKPGVILPSRLFCEH